jgi:hypothetical protein
MAFKNKGVLNLSFAKLSLYNAQITYGMFLLRIDR